jgi:hypothetical protein
MNLLTTQDKAEMYLGFADLYDTAAVSTCTLVLYPTKLNIFGEDNEEQPVEIDCNCMRRDRNLFFDEDKRVTSGSIDQTNVLVWFWIRETLIPNGIYDILTRKTIINIEKDYFLLDGEKYLITIQAFLGFIDDVPVLCQLRGKKVEGES